MGKINYKKKDFAENLSKKKGFSVLLAKKLIDDVIDVLINNISKKKMNIKNIGTFKILNKNERIGRNPKTKEKKEISKRNVVLFKPSKEFKNFVNLKNNE